MTSSVVGLASSSKALVTAKLAPKKGHCLMVCCPTDLLQVSWQNHYIWEVRSANRWDARKTAMSAAGLGQQKGPSSSPQQCLSAYRTTNASEVERIGLRSFASSTIFPWPLANWLLLLQAFQQLFAGKMLPQLAGGRNAFQEFFESLSMDFYATGINLFLIGKIVLIVMVPILINKDI